MLVTRFRICSLVCLLLLAFCPGLPGVANAASESGAGIYRDAQNQQMAGLHPLLRWQRVVDADKPLEGPVLYQLLFNASGNPGTVPAFDTNPRHLINTPITVGGGNVSIGGMSVNGGSGLITFANGQTFPGTASGGVQLSAGTGIGVSPSPITGAGTISLNTAFTDARYLQLTGGNLTGPETITVTTSGPSGLYVTQSSTSATAINAHNTATGVTTISNAIYAETDADNGIGVYGNAPSTASGSSSRGVYGVSSGPAGTAIEGVETASTGTATGVRGTTSSAGGIGIAGVNNAASGMPAFGAFGSSASPNGTGVYGTVSATSDTSNTNGVQGVTASPVGIGVNGLATDATGGTTGALGSVGVQGQSNSPGGIGVNAFDLYQCLLPLCDPSLAPANPPVGIFARVLHANGVAVLATAGSAKVGCAPPACDPAKTGNIGVLARSFHPNGTAVYGIASDTSTTNNAAGVFSVGVFGQARSPTSYALYANYIPASLGVGAAALFNNAAGFTAAVPSKLCVTVATCTILELQANGTREFHFDGAGNAHAAGTFVGGGADFAESVAVRGERRIYEPGDVLAIDPSGTRRLTKAHEPYSTAVAGIVSTKPVVMGSSHNPTTMEGQKEMQDEAPLAVVGIVPCKVSSENGPIRPGDLLVTSSTPGYAMKGTDRARMLGAVVGKAMQPLANGTGTIEVLVTLQ